MGMAVDSGGARGQLPPAVKKPPLKNNRNQSAYLNILGILGMELHDFSLKKYYLYKVRT